MAEISASMVKELREKTGAGMMDCKKALTESAGDFDKAEDWLRKKGISRAASKGGRIAAEGLIGLASTGKAAAMVEVNCETDFVARNPDFKKLADDVARQILEANPADVDALLATSIGGKPVKDVMTDAVAKIGEHMSIRRFARQQVSGAGVIGSYVHGNGKVGVLVEVTGAENADAAGLAKELALQVAGLRPLYVSREEVPAASLDREKEIFREELRQANKPEAIWDKILTGKIEKYYEQVCLVDQPWIKEDKKKIKQLISETSKKAGTDLTVKRFARIDVGEGIEKKKEDLAAEVAKTIGETKA
jgi:elongation factor Ts